MKQAILTKHLGPTNTKGARVKAWCEAGSFIVDWDHAHNSEWNHWFAAWCLGDYRKWPPIRLEHGGALPDGTGYCFVQVERNES